MRVAVRTLPPRSSTAEMSVDGSVSSLDSTLSFALLRGRRRSFWRLPSFVPHEMSCMLRERVRARTRG